MSDSISVHDHQDERRLEFLRDEGLKLLAAYCRISSAEKRRLIMQLVLALAGEGEREA